MKKLRNILWGVVLIALGLIFGLNALEITNINIFFDGWWTLFIIVPCFIDLFKNEDITGNIIGLLIGFVLLLCCQDLLEFAIIWKLLLPTILVIIGLSLIFKDVINGKVKKKVNNLIQNRSNTQEYCATFGGQNLNFHNKEFEGCDLTAVFGGIKCDLRNSIIKKDTIINANAIFGEIDILVPEDINIEVTTTPIFGGVSNKKISSSKDKSKTIYIKATCIFGGVDIK